MTDRPILFSAPMVRALLNDSKTQTRRVLNPQPFANVGGFLKVFGTPPYFEARDLNGDPHESAFPKGENFVTPYPTIRFGIGDRLWARETWRIAPDAWEGWDPEATPCAGWVDYRAGGDAEVAAPSFSHVLDAFGKSVEVNWDCVPDTWRPSIFMPRWASRLTLIVEDVRVERLQDISEADAIAEGVSEPLVMDDSGAFYGGFEGGTYRCGFAGLWTHINGPDAWEANPWVVAVTFAVERQNIDRIAA